MMSNMIVPSFIILSILVIQLNCLNLNGKEYTIRKLSEGNGVSIRVVYTKDDPPKPWVARSVYNRTYLKTGWDTFDIETNHQVGDEDQAYLAGYLEGLETQVAIYDHFYNTIPSMCNDTKLCQRIQDYLGVNTVWMEEMMAKHSASDVYWKQVKLFYIQMVGLWRGYSTVATAEKKMDFKDILWMNFNWDIGDLISAFKNETDKVLQGNGHCSALIKLLPGQSDIFVAHNTWTGIVRYIFSSQYLDWVRMSNYCQDKLGYLCG